MRNRVFALLIHNHPETFEPLKEALRRLLVETYSVHASREAEALIGQCQPHLVFVDIALWQESWTRILGLAEKADVPFNVIVVGAIPNSRIYLSAMERGAFDFIAPPFELPPLNFVVQSAASDIRNRREALATAMQS